MSQHDTPNTADSDQTPADVRELAARLRGDYDQVADWLVEHADEVTDDA